MPSTTTTSTSFFRKMLERAKTREAMEAILLVLAAVAFNMVFGYFSMIFAFILSFFEWDYLSPLEFVGLENYVKILRDLSKGFSGVYWLQSPFFTGLRNILIYTAFVVPTQTILAIVLGTLANQKLKGTTFYKLVYFLPGTTSAVIISLLFIWLFRKQGFINWVFQNVAPGFAPDWLNEPNYVIPAMALVAIWGTSGHFTVSFLAALQSIPPDLYEAAALDGAGRFKRFWYITLPMLKPMTIYVLIMGIIGTLQMFDLAFVLGGSTGGGPGGMGYTVTMDIYKEAFVKLRVGLAAAKSFALFTMVFGFTYIIRKRYEVIR
ncbi:MAG: carbohydrate ABC transporter permease [Candidatus Hodarchaeota archaeon]